MKSKLLICSLLLVFGMPVLHAEKKALKEIYLVSNVDVKTPIMIDTTDVNGGKFAFNNLLTSFVPPIVDSYAGLPVLKSDTASVFNWTKPSSEASITYYEFKIAASRFSKAKIIVSSTTDITIYVNGVKKDGVTSSELGLSKGTEKSVELSLLTQTYTIGVTCLSKQKSEVAPALKIAITTDSKNVQVVPLGSAIRKNLSYLDVINVTSPYDVTISAKGTFYMNKLSTTLPNGEKTSWLEVLDRETGKCLLKSTTRLDMAWMPKSELLYFIEKQGDKRLLKTLNPATMEEKVLSKNLPEGWISWSPDEGYLILTVTDKYKAEEKDLKYYLLPNDRFAGWRNRSILYKLDLTSGATTQLTFGNKETSLEEISPDGKRFILRTNEITITKRPFNASSFYEYNFETAKLDTLWTNQASINDIKYSPDGTKLLILGAPAAFNKLGENIGKRTYSNDFDVQAYLYDFSTKKVEPITKEFNPTIQLAYWNKPGKSIYFKVVDRDYECVYNYSIADKTFTKLPLEVDVAQQISFTADNQLAVYRGMSASYPTKAFLIHLNDYTSTLISDPEKSKMSQIKLGEVQDYNFKSKDGSTIYGRYYVPADFDATKKYPMIVYYYGGTTPTPRTFGSNWNFHYWASMGYVVYVVQPSGAIGFGQAFSAKHVNTWGDISSDDIIQGVKSFSASHAFVNSKKIGCLGASYGGYMTMHLQTKTNIFATAISHAGISALSSYWGNGYWGYGYSATATADTYPWSNPKFYTDHSPLFHADKINTPLLLIQGDDDTNVPAGESMQMYTAMKILGKEVAMVRVKDEDHIITAYQRRIDWNYSIMAWMAKYLQDDSSWWESIYPEAKKK